MFVSNVYFYEFFQKGAFAIYIPKYIETWVENAQLKGSLLSIFFLFVWSYLLYQTSLFFVFACYIWWCITGGEALQAYRDRCLYHITHVRHICAWHDNQNRASRIHKELHSTTGGQNPVLLISNAWAMTHNLMQCVAWIPMSGKSHNLFVRNKLLENLTFLTFLNVIIRLCLLELTYYFIIYSFTYCVWSQKTMLHVGYTLRSMFQNLILIRYYNYAFKLNSELLLLYTPFSPLRFSDTV